MTRSREARRLDALAAWKAGVEAASPEAAVARAVAARPNLGGGRCMVVAVGKAAAGMWRGYSQGGGAALSAFVLVPSGVDPGVLPGNPVLLRGGHPHPTSDSARSTERLLREVDTLAADDRLVLLLSGGASALLEAPADGLAFDDVAAAHRVLVAGGLPIAAINLVRGCLSAVKAGGLAARAHPAATTTLVISDVEGDDPATIGSGPTVPAAAPLPQRCARALEVAGGLDLPASIRRFLLETAARKSAGGAPCAAPDYTVVASIGVAVAAARAELALRGYRVAPDRGYLRGDTATAAAAIAAALAPVHDAAVWGGETTVALPPGPTGRGGRNLDLAARLALAFAGRDDVAALAAGTDGCDGSSRAAGACIDGQSAARAAAAGRPLASALVEFDTETAHDAAGDLVVSGPTGTNVGDLVVVVRG